MTEHKHEEHKEHKTEDSWDSTTKIVAALIGILLIVLIYNGVRMSNISKEGIDGGTSATLDSSILPKGIPLVYGAELGVSFDDISTSAPQKADATIGKLGNLDRTLTLTGDNLKRYTEIVLKISCEYCCGAASIIFNDGSAACGCAHSFAMRGLAKYLIKNHGTEFGDDQILEELGKWKVLFFPEIHMQKAAVLKQQGIELSYINLASNLYRGIEKGASGGAMVGGC